MASPLGASGAVRIPTTSSDDIDIQISEQAGLVSEGLSLSTWGAAYILARSLHKIQLPATSRLNPSTNKRLQVLELGAGTGLVGLAAAALWRASTTLTDLPAIVPGVAANVALNEGLLERCGGSATCAALDWTDPAVLGPAWGKGSLSASGGQQQKQQDPATLELRSNRPDLILAADTIYDEDHPGLLVDVIKLWLARSADARMVMCYPLRMAYIDHIREFWSGMEAAGLECESEGREEGVEEWNEVASTPFEWCVWRWSAARSTGESAV